MALNFGLLDQGGPTNFFEGYSQGQEKMQANAMAQQRAAQAQQEFGMRQQEFAAGQADKQRVAKAAVVTQKTASARDALLRAPTAADARRIVEMQYADPDLGPIRGRFGSLAQALAEIPEEASAFQQYKEQEAMGMEEFLKQQGSNRAFTTAMGGAPQTNAMGVAPTNAMVAPAMSGELQNKLGQRERLAMLADQSPQVKATINRLDSDIARLVEEQKPEPGFTLSAGQIRYPRGYTGVATAPAAALTASAVPPSVAEYQFAKTADGGNFVGSYQDFVKAKADAARGPTPVAAPPALPASVQEYEYAKTVPGGSFVGTYQDFVKAKADAARAPAPISAPQALPQSVAEYNFAKTPEGGGFVGTLTDFMQARAEATRAPAPIVAPQAQPASVLEYNFAKTPDGGGFVGTYQDFVQSKAEAGRAPVPITAPPTKVAEYEFAKTPAGGNYKGTYTQFLNLGKSEGGGGAGGAAGTGTVEVVDPKDRTKTIIVTKARAVAEGLTPAKAIEGLTPQMRQKLEASYPQATTSLRGHQNKTTLFIKDLEALRDSEGLDSVTGFAAGRAPGLTDAGRRTVALYDKVVAKGGFQSLQDMRDMSKTGGALGNVSDRENTQLKASFAAIDRKQNAADVRTALNDLIKELQGGLGRLQDAYDLTYEYKRGNAAPAAGGVDANNPLLRGK